MTTILHCASYSLATHYATTRMSNKFSRGLLIALGSIIGGYPDLAKYFYGETDIWSGVYRTLHQINWTNSIFILHTGLDYITHDHIKGGWTWYAIPVECVLWCIIGYLVYRIWKKNKKGAV